MDYTERQQLAKNVGEMYPFTVLSFENFRRKKYFTLKTVACFKVRSVTRRKNKVLLPGHFFAFHCRPLTEDEYLEATKDIYNWSP